MIPQGTSITNPSFFTASIAAVNGATTCEQLSAAAANALASLNAEITTVTAQLASLAPLVIAPANLAQALTWIANMIGPMIIAQATYTAQLTALTTNLANLTAAINAKHTALGC